MRRNRFAAPCSLALAAAIGAACSLPAAAETDLAEVAEMPTFPLLSNLRLDSFLSSLEVGCDWIQGADSESKNIGYPDTHAGYFFVSLPVNPGPDVSYTVSGSFPQLRYFGFQLYDGFRPGNLVDSLPDARVVPTRGLPPALNPAVLPVRGNYIRRYVTTIKFQTPPGDPALREPNTIYAGQSSNRGALAKQLVYRTYLPNPGIDKMGGVALPTVVYHGPKGDIDLRDTPDQRACNTIKRRTEDTNAFPVLGSGSTRPKFKPVSQSGTLVFYPNGDINYLRAQILKDHADMVLIRAKAPLAPNLPTQRRIASPQARYWSICQNELNSSAVVACIADRNMTLQADGYLYAVISTPEKRPPMADAAFGYNWLPFGQASNGIVGFRQMLADPDFEGNYGQAVARPNRPISETLGEWAPEITYCDRDTFDALADVSGATVFAGCRHAQ